MFDGRNEHIFNVNNKHLFDHSLLNAFTLSFSNQTRPSLTAFMKEREGAYAENGSDYKMVAKSYFAVVWRTFIVWQDWKFSLVCPLCDRALRQNINNEPNGETDCIVADGVHTGFGRDFGSDIITPKQVFDKEYYVKNYVKESDRYIPDPTNRKLLERYFYEKLPPISQDRVCL